MPGENVVADRETFGRYLKEALGAYHDPVLLQTTPLLALLAPQPVTGEPATAALRQQIRDAIETLRPVPSLDSSRPEWLRYRLLTLRYLRSYTPVEVSDELGISQTTFYRYNQEAVEAVAGVLWEAYQREQARPGADHPGPLSPDEQAQEEAMRLAREAQRLPVDLGAILAGSERLIRPLAVQRGLDLEIEAPTSLPTIWGDPAVIRQILLNALTEALALAASGHLRLTVEVGQQETLWRLHGLAHTAEDMPERLAGLEISRGLLDVYGGRLWVEGEGGSSALCLAIPVGKPHTVLVVDDDNDTIRLYQRCLQAHGIAVETARNAEQMKARLATSLPELVLLDVLMPQEDGWDMLQYLKAMPETAHVPVVVCSVLSQEGLALALGAAEVLRKPIAEATLIKMVQAILARPPLGAWRARADPKSPSGK